MAEGNITTPRIDPALGINPTGGVMQLTGMGIKTWIKVRETVDGTVGNAELLNNYYSSSTLNAWDVSKAPYIVLHLDPTLGSLTSMSVTVEFYDGTSTTGWSRLTSCSNVGGVITVSEASILMNSAANVHFFIPNPGSAYMKVFTSSIGTVTSSSLRIYMGFAMNGAWNIGL